MTLFAACAIAEELNLSSRFTGKERHAESCMDYVGARYYESSLGRFVNPDWSAKAEPVQYAKLADPQSLNLYNCVQNDPEVSVDRDGHLMTLSQYQNPEVLGVQEHRR
jgi:RHS repeat-associated protein